MLKMITLKDHTEWLKHRQNYIGGSEAAAILGQNPYMSNLELWRLKTGREEAEDISSKPYVKYGVDAEPIIRQLFSLNYPKYEMHYEDNNSWLNDKLPYAAASLDGWLVDKTSGRHGIWECKTSEVVSSMHKEKWNESIPQNYYCQLLHYLLVREDCEFAHLTALLTWKREDKEIFQQLKNYHIERADVQEDINYLKEQEEAFWKYVQRDIEPNLILPTI